MAEPLLEDTEPSEEDSSTEEKDSLIEEVNPDSYELLVEDMRNIIMGLLIENNIIGAVMLACTCKAEKSRYIRLCPSTKRLTYRQYFVNNGDDMDPQDCGNGEVVLRGEPGYKYLKRENDKCMIKITRTEWKRPMILKKKEQKRCEQRYNSSQWKRGNYE